MDSVDDWRRRALEKKAVSTLTLQDRKLGREAWMNAGIAVEFALKAVIMRNERFNRWPDSSERRDLHTHDLRALFRLANIEIHNLPTQMRANVMTVLAWSRGHDYDGRKLPRRIAQQMHVAAFDDEHGVFTWLMR